MPFFLDEDDRSLRADLGTQWSAIAQIASDDASFDRIHTGTTEWANSDTHSADNTLISIGLHCTGYRVAIDRAGRTRHRAGRFLTLLAHHRDAVHVQDHLDYVDTRSDRVATAGM
jgi:hypothetical protein